MNGVFTPTSASAAGNVKLADENAKASRRDLAARGIPFVVATAYDLIPSENNGARVFRKLFMPHEVIEAIADILRP